MNMGGIETVKNILDEMARKGHRAGQHISAQKIGLIIGAAAGLDRRTKEKYLKAMIDFGYLRDSEQGFEILRLR